MVSGDASLGKGRPRSIWTQRLQRSGSTSQPGGEPEPLQQHAPPQQQHQQPPRLDEGHTSSSQMYYSQQQLTHHPPAPADAVFGGPGAASAFAGGGSGPSAGGGGGGPGAGTDDDTPRKLDPALSHLAADVALDAAAHAGRGRRGALLLSGLDRDILCNAFACAGASMADPLMSMVDSVYAGALGTTALAALAANGALFTVLFFLCFTALAVLCTQAMAAANSRGDAEGLGRGFLQALAATLLVSGLLMGALLAAPEAILGCFQTNAEVMPLARTYCIIRALSLPAALSMNVCQAAFRSLLDLTTPFCVVMLANAANYCLNHLLMVRMSFGMAGCGWASVISQYLGAGVFAALIYRRRHKFGIPEALAAAAERAQQQHKCSDAGLDPQQQHGSGGGRAAVSGTPWWQRLAATAWPAQRGRSTGGGSWSAKAAGMLSPLRPRESSGSLRIDVTAFEQQLSQRGASASGGSGRPLSPSSPARRRAGSRHAFTADCESRGSCDAGPGGSDALAAAVAAAGAAAAAPNGHAAHRGLLAGGGSHGQLCRLDSSGSDSKLPRGAASSYGRSGGGGGCSGTLLRLWWLLESLDWVGFAQRYLGMTVRGLLILSMYTSASVVAARGGTSMMAAHQVVQQQQQLQMSFAWSFLHVGQSMTANLYHAAGGTAAGGPKAARRLAQRIVSWSTASCTVLAVLTFSLRGVLPGLFTRDAAVRGLVSGAALPAALMLGLAWNQALEGVLLAADEQPYVVRVYPAAVGAALLQLLRTHALGLGLPGVWWGLASYYAVLLAGFGARFWARRGRF